VTTVSESGTWRQLLAVLICDPEERKRISRASGIEEVTLKRYAENKTKRIRLHMFWSLVAAVPQEYRARLIALICEKFPEISLDAAPPAADHAQPEAPEHVQLQVYERALRARATTPLSLRSWAICNLVLSAALEQLDPGPQMTGIKVVLVQCMCNPRGDAVNYLRETFLLGTPPWRTDQTTPLLLGAASLSSYAVTSGRPSICQNVRTNPTFLPVRQEEHEESAVAYPLRQGERVGGCFLVATQPDFFTSQRLPQIDAYADLLVLTPRDDEFYEKSAIRLRAMPASDVQRAHFASFRSRLNALVSAPDHKVANIVESEQLVWSQLGALTDLNS